MATIAERKNKRGTSYLIEFRVDGLRRSLFLPCSYTRKQAETVASFVERCAVALDTGRPYDRQTSSWLASLVPDLRKRFVSSGLIDGRASMTLREMFDAYLHAESGKFKASTLSNKELSIRRFLAFVRPDTPVCAFTRVNALSFVSSLRSRVSEASLAGYVKDVKRAFNWAVTAEIIDKNPFDGVKRGSFKNKSREFFVDRGVYARLLDASPSQEFRALLALYRIGGLRRAEAFCLEWSDVDFARGRVRVPSPKTEAYEGRESRVIPLFPELRDELEPLWSGRQEGSSSLILSPSCRTSLTYRLRSVLSLAGVARWDRLIQNLRASRSIEVYNEFGALAESEWIGHSLATARDHYLHLLDADFERATVRRSVVESVGMSSDIECFLASSALPPSCSCKLR